MLNEYQRFIRSKGWDNHEGDTLVAERIGVSARQASNWRRLGTIPKAEYIRTVAREFRLTMECFFKNGAKKA